MNHPTTYRPEKIIIIHSPHAGRSYLLQQALQWLKEDGVQVADIVSIAELDALPLQGKRWKKQGIDLAVAAGGDGVVGGTITHIVDSGLPLGILPLGTGNDIARSIGIPQNLRQAIQVLRGGNLIPIDIGTAVPAQQAPHQAAPSQRQPVQSQIELHNSGYFAHALTVGLNVQFARLATNVATRKRFGALTYPVSALDALRHYSPFNMTIHLDGLAVMKTDAATGVSTPLLVEREILCCRALQTAVINAPFFGGMWQFAIPRATLHDRLLDIVIILDTDLSQLPTLFAQWLHQLSNSPQMPADRTPAQTPFSAAELSHLPGIHHFQAKSITITTDIDPQDVTLDGEVRGQTPIYVATAERMLHVLVPGDTF